MKLGVYTVRDTKVGFLAPFCDQTDVAACRGFGFMVNGKEGIMNYSPKDFDLYKIGEFDTEKGVLEAGSIPVLIISGTDALNS